LGVRLIQRSARSFAVTPVGEIVYSHAQKMVNEAEAAEAAASEALSEPSGNLRISASVMMGELVLAQLLSEFAQKYPKVKIAMSLTDRFVDVAGERYDLAIRATSGPLVNSDLVAKLLWQTQFIVVASPDFLDTHGMPKTPHDLAGAPCVGLGTADAVRKWVFRDKKGTSFEVAIESRLTVDNLIAAVQAAVHGFGFAYVPDYTCHRELQAGTLRPVLTDWGVQPGPVHAVYPTRRGVTSAVRHLIDFLAERMSKLESCPAPTKAA
jgi:DNA-binding transcriptional LysR family regulator